jgi:hypothetical protein
MTQLAMTKANRASLLWLALCLSRCESMPPRYAFHSDVASACYYGQGGVCVLRASLNTSPSERRLLVVPSIDCRNTSRFA